MAKMKSSLWFKWYTAGGADRSSRC